MGRECAKTGEGEGRERTLSTDVSSFKCSSLRVPQRCVLWGRAPSGLDRSASGNLCAPTGGSRLGLLPDALLCSLQLFPSMTSHVSYRARPSRRRRQHGTAGGTPDELPVSARSPEVLQASGRGEARFPPPRPALQPPAVGCSAHFHVEC